MTVSVIVPWRPGCPWRERAWAWVQERYAETHPEWEIVVGGCADGPFNRAEAIADAAGRATGDILIVADADVWVDPGPAVPHADRHGWALPHAWLHRLSAASTERVLAGEDWRGLPLSEDNSQDAEPYRVHPTGAAVVLRRDVLLDVPPDPRFVGWGHEDNAWSRALHTLVGKPGRVNADLVHLWHPPQERQDRTTGSPESAALERRYRTASRNRILMRSLIDEVQRCSTTSSSTAEGSPTS